MGRVLVELNQKYWAFRTGYFLVPTTSNVNSFDIHIPSRGEYAGELELRYASVVAARQIAAVRMGEPRHGGELPGGGRLAADVAELPRTSR